jgi:hypothetical protein
MKCHIKPLIAIFAAVLGSLIPAAASAERVYFLVGVRHIYQIGPDRDLHLAEREEIEKNYADGVASDQDVFNKHVADGADSAKESDLLNSDLDALADARDSSLGTLFELRDDIRETHPDLRIQGDGPYQVMGIEMHMDGSAEVFDQYAVYAPWPGYVVVGGCYGGWNYGVWYDPGIFFNLYLGWFNAWPGGRFYGGFYGHSGRVVFSPHGFIDHSAGARSGGAYSRSTLSRGYTHSASAGVRSTGYGRSTSAGTRSTGYTHSRSVDASSSSHTRSGSVGMSSSGYTHSGSAASRSRSSYTRPGTTSAGSGASRSSSGYTHTSSGSSHRGVGSGGSSYSRSSTSGSRSGYSRSSGSSRGSQGSGSSSGGTHSSSRGSGNSRSGGSSNSQKKGR